jgi:lipopolysaccharide assembly outer membrane protein LptD (OstA)
VFSISGGAQYNMRTSFNASADPNSFSNLLGLMTVSPFENVSASLEGEYNPTRSFINRIAGSASAHDAAGDAVSASYVVNATELGATSETLQATGKLAISQRWGVSGSVNYDMLQKFTQQIGVSVAYTHPCWDITLAAHRTNRPTGTSSGQDIGASLLIGFKGLGSVASDEQ